MGLWGGISGYAAIHGDDTPTVYGAYFNHEGETAGLGAEIKDSQAWQEKFIGKKVFIDGTQDVALSVVKTVNDAAREGGYHEGINRIRFKAPEDRYAGQLKELAQIIRGEIPNPPGLYEHDRKVHKVSLDACNIGTEAAE
jgi:hypothetical protein